MMNDVRSLERTISDKKRHSWWNKFWKQRDITMLLLPAVLLAFIFHYIPLAGIYLSFVKYQIGKSIFSANWVGLANYIDFFRDSFTVTSRVFRNTIMINFLGMLVGLSFPCLFAVLLNELSSSGFKRTTQFITFFPFFLSPIVVYSIVYSFLAVNSGLVNQILKNLGIISTGINFMSDKAWAWPMIIGKNLWKGFGYTSVIYLASISGIDQEQYEAAEIDGAGRFARIRHITIPHLYPTITVLMILNIGALLTSNFATIYMYVNELNRPMLEVFSTYVYREGIRKLNFSYATAAGFVLSLIGLFLMLSANWFSKHFTGRAIF